MVYNLPLILSGVGIVLGLLNFYLLLRKSKPVYLQSNQEKGHAVCSQCKHTVARYFHRGGSPVCANCDHEGFKKSVKV